MRPASPIGWQGQVKRILRHLNGGPSCTPTDLLALQITLREPTRPPRSADVERECDLYLQARDSRADPRGILMTRYMQGTLMPGYKGPGYCHGRKCYLHRKELLLPRGRILIDKLTSTYI